MQRPLSQHPTFVPGVRLSRLPVRTGPESLEDFYRDLFAKPGPEHDQERLLRLLDEDVADGAAAKGRAGAMDHLDRAFQRIDAWTLQGDFLPQADRSELKRRVAHNLLAVRPGLDLVAESDNPDGPDHGILRQVEAEHAAWQRGWTLSAIADNATGTSGQNGTSVDNSTSGPLDETIQGIFGQEGQSGPLDDELEDEFDLKGATAYWTVQPNPGACEKCQAMAGKIFTEKPERPHPNCKCLIQEHKVQGRMRWISGSLSGFEDIAMFKLNGGKQVIITITNIGPVLSGISIDTNYGFQGSHIAPPIPNTNLNKITFYFNANDKLPIRWNIRFQSKGSDNTMMMYKIIYMEIQE